MKQRFLFDPLNVSKINILCGSNSDTVLAGLILHQSYIPEKCRANQNGANQIEKFQYKTEYFLEVRGLTTSSYKVYDYTASGGYMDLYSIYLLYIQYIHISVQYT